MKRIFYQTWRGVRRNLNLFTNCHTPITVCLMLLQNLLLAVPEVACADTRGLELDYGIVMDAGSSGTRIRVYSWPGRHEPLTVPSNIRQIYNEKSDPQKHGLSEYWDKTDLIEPYLKELIDGTKAAVPAAKRPHTPIYLMATAGLRLVGEQNATKLLDMVRGLMMDKSFQPYHFIPRNARILSGEEEGVFAWLAVNYLLGHFDGDQHEEKLTGIIELGGASLQIAFIPKDPILADKFSLLVGGKMHSLYVHSYLGYGQDRVTGKIEEFIARNTTHPGRELDDPCKLVDDRRSNTVDGVEYNFRGTGKPDECLRIIRDAFFHDKYSYRCAPRPCAIGSIYQPRLPETLDFYALSAMVHVVKSLEASSGEDGAFNPRFLMAKAHDLCIQNFTQLKLENNIPARKLRYVSADCAMGLYIPQILHSFGFKVDSAELTAAYAIDTHAIEWSLGAILYELEQQPEQCGPIASPISSCPSARESSPSLLLLTGIVAFLSSLSSSHKLVFFQFLQ